MIDARKDDVRLLRDVLSSDDHAVGGRAFNRISFLYAFDGERDFLYLPLGLALLEKAYRQALGHAGALLDGCDHSDLTEFESVACKYLYSLGIYAVVVNYPDLHGIHYISKAPLISVAFSCEDVDQRRVPVDRDFVGGVACVAVHIAH